MELLMIFIGGLLGSSHCVGMCGGFALTLGANSGGVRENLPRQLVYSLGRVLTYSLAGAVAGYGGFKLVRGLPQFVHVQAGLAILAGVLLVVQGLWSAGVLPRVRIGKAAGPSCLALGPFAALLRSRQWTHVFVAGVCTAFLPCGLVYAFLALASSSGDLLGGLLRMGLFGLGTVPLMVLTGIGGNALNLAARRHAWRLAGWCVALTGVLSIWRGIGFWNASLEVTGGGCPFCH